MEEYYTNTSDYSSGAPKYVDQPVQQPPIQQPPIQQPPIQTSQYIHNPHGGIPNNMAQYKYKNSAFNIDFKDVIKRVIKYLVEGLAVAFVAYYFVGKGKLNIKDIVYLGITAAFVFAILDTFSPTISLGARFGAGFGIGQGLFGLNPVLVGGPGIITPFL